MRTDFDHESMQPRASASKKWKYIISHIWKGIKDGEVDAIHLIDTSEKGIFADNHIENGKLYLRKNGCCYRIREPKQGNGLYFSPQPPYLTFGFSDYDLYLDHNGKILGKVVLGGGAALANVHEFSVRLFSGGGKALANVWD